MKMMGFNSELYSKVIQVCSAKIKLVSNIKELLLFKKGLIADIETDFYKVEEIEFCDDNIDGHFYIINEDSEVKISISSDNIIASGNIQKLENEAEDIRWSLLGNEGLFYRFVLKILESKKDIYSFHACSLFDDKKNHLYIISGGAGAGKSIFLLNAIKKGLKIFSTEMTHFKVDHQDLTFFKGSILDNVRVGNLKHDFPEIADDLNLEFDEESNCWNKKIVIDLSRYQVSDQEIVNPQITLIFPHIERNMKESILSEIKDKKDIIKQSFDNISSKISESILLYEQVPVNGLDTPRLAMKRLKTLNDFINNEYFYKSLTLYAGVKNCLKEVIR
jgi:hypothetical protein